MSTITAEDCTKSVHTCLAGAYLVTQGLELSYPAILLGCIDTQSLHMTPHVYVPILRHTASTTLISCHLCQVLYLLTCMHGIRHVGMCAYSLTSTLA